MFKLLLFSLLFLSTGYLFSQHSKEVEDALRNNQYGQVLNLLENELPSREGLLLKAHCLEKTYNYPAAMNVYKQLLGDYPDDANLIITMAECASQIGDKQQSLRYWIMADSLSPGNHYIQTKKSMAFYQNDNWKEAIEEAKTVFKVDSVPLLLRMVGDAYLHSSKGDSAIWYYYKTLEKNPADRLAVSKLGKIYLGAKFYDAAIDLTQSYLENINPSEPIISQLNGIAHFSEGNYAEAAQRLNETVALGDSSYTTCYYLGVSLYGLKSYYEAIPWLERAYMKNNSDVYLLYHYGTALSKLYDRKKGIEILSEGVAKIEEMNAMLFDFDRSFADVYKRLINYPKAIEYLQSAYRRKPDAHSLLYDIARCYELMSDNNNAITYYNRFLKTAPQSWVREDYLINVNDSVEINTAETLYQIATQRAKVLKEELVFQAEGEKNLN